MLAYTPLRPETPSSSRPFHTAAPQLQHLAGPNEQHRQVDDFPLRCDPCLDDEDHCSF